MSLKALKNRQINRASTDFSIGFAGIIFLLITLLLTPTAQAMVGVELMTQKSRWTIDQLSIQENVSQTGTYLYLPLGGLAYLEGAQEQLELSYKATLPSLKQGDRSAVFNLLLGPFMLSAGVHQVKSTNPNVDQGKTTAYQFNLPEILHLSLGYSSFKTKFPDFVLTDRLDQKGLEVKQQSPEIGLNFFDGSVGLRSKQSKIQLSDSLGRGQTEYASTQVTGTFWLQPFYFTYSKWTGDRLFYADNKALYLNSLEQVYHGGNQASITWMPASWMDLAINRSNDNFFESGFLEPLKSQTDTLSLTLRF